VPQNALREQTMADFTLDKSVLQVSTLEAQGDDRQYWFAKTPEERLAAMEYLRRINYGHDRVRTRLQRVLEVIEFPPC
jgi:hypothetical protein